MNRQQCLSYLEKIQSLGIKLGLDNVRKVLSSFQNPHQKYPSVLVAGTNGKGSVCAYLTRILSLHDFRVGLFTSPHLVRVEERIRIGEKDIPARTFCRLLTLLKERIEELLLSKELLSPPTYFETLTCLAFLYFEEQKVDAVVLEVGMGGRLDATNVVDPVISVITTISGEHQKFLGETVSQIAFEKAGIIKRGVPVVCGVEEEEAFGVIQKRAEELRAPFFGVFEREGCFLSRKKKNGYSFIYRMNNDEYHFSPSLRGEHQGKNAAVAIATSKRLSGIWRSLEKKKIIEGIEQAKWDGRLEVVSNRPLIIVDGAHNCEGAQALKKYIRDFLPSPLILVFAVMNDKEIAKMADILFSPAEKVVIPRLPLPRAAEPEEIVRNAKRFEDRMVFEPDLKQAVRLAVQSAGSRGCVLIAGSLYLAGEAKRIFSSEKGFCSSLSF